MYSPKSLFSEQPLFEREAKIIKRYRQIAKRICAGEIDLIPIIVGPCSIHSIEGALEYAKRIKDLYQEVSETLFPIMRVYVEKPRTTIGWKGLLYDPFLNGTNDIASGIRAVRYLLTQLARLGIPTATEFVNPLTALYFKDLVTWGFIGARTSASQIHREFASSLTFPVGFKNDLNGNLHVAINSIIGARSSHTYLSLNTDGLPALIKSHGNPFTHLVLRGSDNHTNFDSESIEEAISIQGKSGLTNKVLIDCAHGNSKKNPGRQKEVFFEVSEQISSGNTHILGLMLESYLEEGNQPFEHGASISPTRSITDPCISWEDTETLLRWLNNSLKKTQAMLLV